MASEVDFLIGRTVVEIDDHGRLDLRSWLDLLGAKVARTATDDGVWFSLGRTTPSMTIDDFIATADSEQGSFLKRQLGIRAPESGTAGAAR